MEQFEHIDVIAAKKLLDEQGALLADIRDEKSYLSGHAPGAMHLTNQTLIQLIEEHDPDAPVIVMCYHGISSQGAAQYLLTQGLEKVYSLDGGFEAWAKIYPVTGSD